MTASFTIIRKGRRQDLARLKTDAILTLKDFRSIARALGAPVVCARKTGFVSARRASKYQVIQTRWNGIETTNTARPGDWVVTNLTRQKKPLRDTMGYVNTYVIRVKRFANLYERTDGMTRFGAIYQSKSIVSVIALRGGFDIRAPWGERQKADRGYLVWNGKEVYGINEATFAATYDLVTH
jgi:hypothetical protein